MLEIAFNLWFDAFPFLSTWSQFSAQYCFLTCGWMVKVNVSDLNYEQNFIIVSGFAVRNYFSPTGEAIPDNQIIKQGHCCCPWRGAWQATGYTSGRRNVWRWPTLDLYSRQKNKGNTYSCVCVCVLACVKH